jgi:ferredoxin
MLFKVTVMPMNAELWLSANAPLTNIEYEPGGVELIPFGCRVGACGACAIEVIDGLDSLGRKNQEEVGFLETLGFVGEQFRLACQCRVGGEATFRVATPE